MPNYPTNDMANDKPLNISSNDSELKSRLESSNYPKEAEIANARWAMLGFIALVGAYSTTGQIIPGIF